MAKAGVDYIGITTPFYCNDGKGNFLFHKRSRNCRDEQGNWDPGSGQLEYDLTAEENVLKEVREEYGCEGEIQGRLPAHDVFRDNNGEKTHWLALSFFIKVNPKEAKINDPDKMDEIGWFRLDNMPKPLHTGFAFAYDKFRDYFRKYE